MHVKGSIAVEKIVAWAIGIVLALVILYFIITQLGPASEGGLMKNAIDRIFGLNS